jgi:hypothetical protein
MFCIQRCFICHPSDSTVSEDAGIDPRTFATFPLAFRRSNHRLDLIHLKCWTVNKCRVYSVVKIRTLNVLHE